MWIYLVTFITSCFFAYIAENNRKRKFLYLLCSMIAICLPSFLAGLRSPEIGTDIRIYMIDVFRGAKVRSFGAYYKNYKNMIDPLYLVLNYVLAQFTDDRHILQFVIQFIITCFIYKGLSDKTCQIPVWYGLWVYYTIFYAGNLNIMRQSIALSIIFYAMKYIYALQWKPFLIYLLIACGFHRTAIVAVFIYLLYYALKNFDQEKVFKFALIGIIVLVLMFRNLAYYMSVLFPKYMMYVIRFGQYRFSFNPFIIRIPFIIFFAINFKTYKNKDNRVYFWLILLLADILLDQLRTVDTTISRIALYCGIIKSQMYPFISEGFSASKHRSTKNFVTFAICAATLVVFIYQLLMGVNEAYPYKSDVISWL